MKEYKNYLKGNIVLMLLSIHFLFAFNTINKTESKDDVVLVNQILAKTKKIKKNRTIQLNPVNDNSFVIVLVDSLNHYQLMKETKKLQNLRQENGIDEMVYKKKKINGKSLNCYLQCCIKKRHQ